MTIGAHYLDETAAAAIVTIPIASTSLAGWLEYVLTMLDGRINMQCYISTNTSNTMQKAALASVELNAMLAMMRNTRLSREGVPAETPFQDVWFSKEDLAIMENVREMNKFVAVGYSRDAGV